MATLKTLGDSVLAVALILGAVTVLTSLTKGMAEHRKKEQSAELAERMAALAPAHGSLDPTGRFERILVASDGSEYSAGAIRVATALARQNNARLFITGVAVYNPEYASTVPGLEAAAVEAARKAVQGAIEAAAGIAYDVVIAEAEDPYRGIVDAAEEYRADVIVMGRRGKRGLARSMVGDATARVIGHAPCSVLVVPRGAQPFSKGVLVATDGSRYGDAAAHTAGKLALAAQLPLTAVSAVLASHNEARRREAVSAVERIKARLVNQPVTGVVSEGRPEQVILDQAQKAGADIIVMGTHGRTGLDRILMGSVAERVIGFADCPVLAVKA
jgi:nucleotide-binding universal stress UspA family protein